MKQRIWKKAFSGILAASLLAACFPIPNSHASAAEASPKKDLKLWFNKEAPNTYDGWEKLSLPIGNSAVGGNVFGGVQKERINLNEHSLWSGGPAKDRKYNGGNLPEKGKYGETIKEIQKKFATGDTQGATKLCDQLTGLSDNAGTDGYGHYLNYGSMYLDFQNAKEAATNYRRDLDLRTAIASVVYDQNGTHYVRENFASYPDNVLVTRLTADKQTLNFDLSIQPDNEINNSYKSGKRHWETKADGSALTIEGTLDDNQLQFCSHTQIILENGKGTVTAGKEKLTVKDADSVLIITSIGTDYKNTYPTYRTGESKEALCALVKGYVEAAAKKSYQQLKDSHLKDYQNIFSRVELDLGQEVSQKPTDELLNAYNKGTASPAEKRYLEVLLFQYGRYLTIASSRETPTENGKPNTRRASLPANLQGMWVGSNTSSWHADYHMNVNLQMNYWPTYVTNMTECAEPLIDYVDSLRVPGRITAEIYAGIKSTPENPENGFMAHTQNTPYGWTCPGWLFSWGWSPAAVPWILQNCFEYYEYTEDTEYLRAKIYPMLREQAVLYDQLLVNEKTGEPDDGSCVLVSSPSYSPEHGPYTAGNTYEHSLIWQLYQDTIKAANILGVDQDKVPVWKSKQSRLRGPIEIGSDGQIKEWYHETSFGSVPQAEGGNGHGHRHLSHMLGVFPGDLISADTPKYFEAAKVSMHHRTDNSTGWAMGQRINTWARLGEGNKAYELIGNLFRRGILTNLWDTHTPFQIDGNFGYTSGVAEMLMQSNQDYINLLPALPDAWATGSVDGLLTRGNFELSMKWADKALTEATLLSKNGGKLTLQVKNASLATVKDSQGNPLPFEIISHDRIALDTAAGERYTLCSIPTEENIPVPTGLRALKAADNEAVVSWNPIEAAGRKVTYHIYRQVGNGEIRQIAATEQPSYKDIACYDALSNVKYQVSAAIGPVYSQLSTSVPVQDLRNMAGMIDDSDPRIQYTGQWGDYPSKDGNYNDTIKFINSPKGGETVELTFCGTGIKAYTALNTDRGKFEVFIDGVSQGQFDTYGTAGTRQHVFFQKDDLPHGQHTILLKIVGTRKMELDAFEVLDSTAPKPAEVAVSAVSGITTVGKAGSTVQMQAQVLPAQTRDKAVTWSSSDPNLATVDDKGLVTVKSANGKVTITAASKADPSIKGSTDLVIAIAGPVTPQTEDVEDSVDNKTLNPAIKWSDGWSVYAGEANKHHGTTKAETGKEGAWFEYRFTGTGIELYAQAHAAFGSYEVTIDNGTPETVSLNGSANGDPQTKIFSKTGLPNEEHTIKCVAKPREGKKMVCIDYLKVFKEGKAAAVDKSALQDSIAAASLLIENQYPQEKWQAMKTALDAAVKAMNDPAAAAEQVTAAKTALDTAVAALGKPIVPKPVIGDAAGQAILVESTRIVLEWDAIENATSYKVVMGGKEFPTESTHLQIDGLEPGKTYDFKIYGFNQDVPSEDFIAVTGITTAKADQDGPAPVTHVEKKLEGSSIRLTWAASDDPDLAGHYVYIGGVKVADLKAPVSEYLIEDAEEGKIYDVRIAAYDKDLRQSVPVQVFFRLEARKNIQDVEHFDKLIVDNGTAFDALPLPRTVTVTLEGNIEMVLNVVWSPEGYDPNTAGICTLSGKLQLTDGLQNPQNLTAQIQIQVQEKPQPPVTPSTEITDVEAFPKLEAATGTAFDRLPLPETAKVTVIGGTQLELPISWSAGDYQADKPGTYTLIGELTLSDGLENPQNLTARIQVELKTADTPAESVPPTQPGKPVVPQPGNGPAQTGDTAPIAALTTALTLSALAAGAVLGKKKRIGM